jgi:hypothetical protein
MVELKHGKMDRQIDRWTDRQHSTVASVLTETPWPDKSGLSKVILYHYRAFNFQSVKI